MSLPAPADLDATTPDATALDPALLDHLVDTILESVPHQLNDTPETRAARRNATRLVLIALKPADPFAAMLAAQAITAHYAVMDNLRRAAQPDVSDHAVTRLRGNAGALARGMHATLGALHKHHAQPVPAKPAPRPTPQPRPRKPEHAPRLLVPATPIPDPEHAPPSRPYRRWEDMTLAERRAHYGYPGDPTVTANAAPPA
ncbi:MAG TPA: hypothetical protein VFE31_07660 [Opitutaceae bacterium]|nr:hypothetical protein [Opitutaceae bacterium]